MPAGAMSVDAVITAALAQEEAKAAPERRSVPWDNGTERLLVVNLPLDLLYLNPDSHRVKAQLTAHPDRRQLTDDPLSDAAQRIIAEELRKTEGFADLKADISERDQLEPGVVTREGVLVNANTRAVAMRDLGNTHIRVMVLPVKSTPSQIAELELRLQVSRDYKQEYTFTNRLIFIKDCQAVHWTEDRIGSEVYGTAQSAASRAAKVRRDVRTLATIDELIQMSNGRYRYPDFDDKQVALEELDRDYEELKKSDAAAALQLRTTRLVAILSGVGYRDIRHIDENFANTYLEEEIADDSELEFLVRNDSEDAGDAGPSGLGLLGNEPVKNLDVSGRLLNWLTASAGQDEVEVGDGDSSARRARGDVVDGLQTATQKAVAAAKADSQRGDVLDQPVGAVRDATRRLRAAEAAFDRARTDASFGAHAPRLRDCVAEARRQLDSLAARLDAEYPADAGG